MAIEYVIMPKADYIAACDSIRKKTGKTDKIKSGEMFAEIASIVAGGGGGTIVSKETRCPEVAAVCFQKYENNAITSASHVHGSSDWWYRSFLKHDLSSIPSDARIVSAYLNLYPDYGNDSYTQGIAYVQRVLSDWSEEEVASYTWNTQPAAEGTLGTYGEVIKIASINEWYSFDITKLVRQWIEDKTSNFGLCLKDDAEGSWRYNWRFCNHNNAGGQYATYIDVVYEVQENSGDNPGGGGIVPSGSIEITENGIYDVTDKALAIVSVSGTSLPMAEGVRF